MSDSHNTNSKLCLRLFCNQIMIARVKNNKLTNTAIKLPSANASNLLAAYLQCCHNNLLYAQHRRIHRK